MIKRSSFWLVAVALIWSILGGVLLHGEAVIRASETKPAPGNDNVANATPVLGFPYNDTINDDASIETDEMICGADQSSLDFNASAWYSYTPSQNGVLNITVTPNDTTDLSLGLYTGPQMGPTHPLTELNCRNARGDGQAETLIASVTAGTTYYVRVASKGTFGNYTVSMLNNVTIYLPATLKNFPPDDWLAQTSDTTTRLNGIDCASITNCVAVGDNGKVLTTSDAGNLWISGSSGTTSHLNDVSCRDVNNCVAVGDNGRIIASTNGGVNWSSRDSGTSQNLRGVSCATDTCAAVGGTGTSTGVLSENGGDTWTTLPALGNTPLFGVDCPNDGTCTLVGEGGRVLVTAGQGIKALFNSLNINTFESVDCATDQICLIVGRGGVIYRTGNGGSSWSSRDSGINTDLNGISCLNDQTCFAAGDNGVVLGTTDSGSAWESQTAESTADLNDVSCLASGRCFAVGDGGTILRRL